jgi:hypothetical protein
MKRVVKLAELRPEQRALLLWLLRSSRKKASTAPPKAA